MGDSLLKSLFSPCSPWFKSLIVAKGRLAFLCVLATLRQFQRSVHRRLGCPVLQDHVPSVEMPVECGSDLSNLFVFPRTTLRAVPATRGLFYGLLIPES